MAITNKLITFNKLTSFETQLAQGNILDTSIVFIKDAKKIWTKGTYFDCSGGGSSIPIIDDINSCFIETSSGTFNETQANVLRNKPDIFIAPVQTGVMSFPYILFSLQAKDNHPIYIGINDCTRYYLDYYLTDRLEFDITKEYSLSSKLLALKSDIPNTDDFALKSEIPDTSNLATQANLTSAVTQLTTNLAKKQDKLVSGTNIATINNNSILGSGNFDLATTEQLRAKQDTLVSGTNIKTINSTSLLGSGNIAIKDTKNLTYILNTSTSGTVTLQPNACIYMPNPLTGKLAINACSTISSNNADLIESRICFRMPASGTIQSVQFNGVAIRWAGGTAPTFEADFTYEISLFYPSNANSVGPMGVCVGFK